MERIQTEDSGLKESFRSNNKSDSQCSFDVSKLSYFTNDKEPLPTTPKKKIKFNANNLHSTFDLFSNKKS